jgi:hypothetical protein
MAKQSAKKATAKAPAKKAAPKPTAKKAQANGARLHDDMKITLVVKENPRRKGTAAYENYKRYRTGLTIGAYKKAGGLMGKLRTDKNKGRVSVA